MRLKKQWLDYASRGLFAPRATAHKYVENYNQAAECLAVCSSSCPAHMHSKMNTTDYSPSDFENLPRGYKTGVQSQTPNKAQWFVACGYVSTSNQSLPFILSLRMNSSFITSRPDLDDIIFYFGNQADNRAGISRKGLVPCRVTPPAFNPYP